MLCTVHTYIQCRFHARPTSPHLRPLSPQNRKRHAALDALANLSLKNWAGFTEVQRQAICSSLTQNFVKHWRAFTPPSSPPSSSTTTATAAPTGSPAGASGGGGAAELKVLASTTRGLACAINKSGVSPVLEPYLARVVHALNHLVQPAGEGERAAAAAAAARGVGGSAGGGSRSTSGSRSRSRSSRGIGGYRGSGGVSPTRSSASASLSDPRARVRLQALTLLESIAVKDAKSLYQHWALFFSPYVPGFPTGAAVASGVSSEGTGSNNPVLPAGLVSILENGVAPQERAAAAGAVAALVKNAPLRKWMLLLPPPPQPPPRPPPPGTATTSAGGGGVGIGERVESMMLHLHHSLVVCLAREEVFDPLREAFHFVSGAVERVFGERACVYYISIRYICVVIFAVCMGSKYDTKCRGRKSFIGFVGAFFFLCVFVSMLDSLTGMAALHKN